MFVFDFDGITRWPDKARWDMVAGCDRPDAAQSRAAAIVNVRPAGSAGMKHSAHFVEGVKIILRSLLHAAAKPFRAGDFVLSTDTVYCLVDDSRESSTAPIITALALVLDEVANVSPLPNLMSDCGGRGLHSWIFAQSMSQLVGKWGPKRLPRSSNRSQKSSLATSSMSPSWRKSPGSSAPTTQTGTSVQRGIGQDTSSTSTNKREERRMKVEVIRKIPEGKALFLYTKKEAVVKLTPWWTRPDADELRESQDWWLRLEGITT